MSAIACFGKLPQAADFVRRGVASAPMRAFEDWFHDAYTELRATGERGLRFRSPLVIPDRESTRAYYAAVASPSRDRIGREFPLVVATSIDADRLPQTHAALALGCQRFWQAAGEAVEAHQGDDPEALFDAVQSIEPPQGVELSDAEERWGGLLENLGARQMEADIFPVPDDRFYAYHALRLAIQGGSDHRVLLCPAAGHPAYRAFWMEALDRATESKTRLAMVWLEGPTAPKDVAISLGAAPTSILKFALGHDSHARSLWPLTTTHASARSRSKEALGGDAWDDTAQKMGRLIDVVLGGMV